MQDGTGGIDGMVRFFEAAFGFSPLEAQRCGWETTLAAWQCGMPAFLNIPTGNGKTETGATIGAHAECVERVDKVVYAMPTKLQQQNTVHKLCHAYAEDTTRVAVLYGRNEYLCSSPRSEVVMLRLRSAPCGALYQPLSDDALDDLRACVRTHVPDCEWRAVADLNTVGNELGLFLRARVLARTALALWHARAHREPRRAAPQTRATVSAWRRHAVLDYMLRLFAERASPNGQVTVDTVLPAATDRYGCRCTSRFSASLRAVLERWRVRTRFIDCPARMAQEEFNVLHREAAKETWKPPARALGAALQRAGVDDADAARAVATVRHCACSELHCGHQDARARVVRAHHVVLSQTLLLCLQDRDAGLRKTLYGDDSLDASVRYRAALVDDESHTWTTAAYDHLVDGAPLLTHTYLQRSTLLTELCEHGVIEDLAEVLTIPRPPRDELVTDSERGREMVRCLAAYVAAIPVSDRNTPSQICDAIKDRQGEEYEQLSAVHRKVVNFVCRRAETSEHFHLAAKVCRALNRLRRDLRRFTGHAPSAVVLGRAARAKQRRDSAARASQADVQDDAPTALCLDDDEDIGIVRWFPRFEDTHKRLRKHWDMFELCACMSGTLVDVDDSGAQDMDTYLRFAGWDLSARELRGCVCTPTSVQDFGRMHLYIGRTSKSSAQVQALIDDDVWQYALAADREAIALAAERGSGLVMSTAKKRGREQFDISHSESSDDVTHYWYEQDPNTTAFRERHAAKRTCVYHGSKGVMTGTDVPDLAFVVMLNQPCPQYEGIFDSLVKQYYVEFESPELVAAYERLYGRELRVTLRQAIGRLMRGPHAAGGAVLLLDRRVRKQERMLRAVFPGCHIHSLQDLYDAPTA